MKATGHGRDALSAINDLDAFTWPDQQLRSTLMCCLQKIPDTIFLRRFERCTDAHLQRGCLNCPLASKFVGIAAKPTGKKRKGTPHAEQPRASPSPAETGVVGGRRGSSGGRGGRGSSGGRGGRGSCDGRGGRGSSDGREGTAARLGRAGAAAMSIGARAGALASGAGSAALESGASAEALAGRACTAV